MNTLPQPIRAEQLSGALAAALSGTGPAVRISPAGAELRQAPAGIALIVSTSGSTGAPKQVMLSAAALRASAEGTAHVLGGEGQWLLALPTSYIAGAQVLIRSIFAGTTPVVLPGESFSPASFTRTAKKLTGRLRFTSLVPTQLLRLLNDSAACAVLRRFDAILLGGAPTDPELLSRTEGEDLRVIRTYGSAETCGGCVYNGRPLPGALWQIRADDTGDPRVWLGGAMIAEGYLDDPARTAEDFQDEGGTRWYRTSDLGEESREGHLQILGRADDTIISGGLKVSAAAVGRMLRTLPEVGDAFIGSVPDPEWGQRVVAAVQLAEGLPDTRDRAEAARRLRQQAGMLLAAHEVPKAFLFVAEMPLLANGKPDRRAVLDALHGEFAQELPPHSSRPDAQP